MSNKFCNFSPFYFTIFINTLNFKFMNTTKLLKNVLVTVLAIILIAILIGIALTFTGVLDKQTGIPAAPARMKTVDTLGSSTASQQLPSPEDRAQALDQLNK